MARKTTRK